MHTYNDGLVDLAGRDVVVTSQLDVEVPEDIRNAVSKVYKRHSLPFIVTEIQVRLAAVGENEALSMS